MRGNVGGAVGRGPHEGEPDDHPNDKKEALFQKYLRNTSGEGQLEGEGGGKGEERYVEVYGGAEEVLVAARSRIPLRQIFSMKLSIPKNESETR